MVAALAAGEWRIIGPKMVCATAELVRPGGSVTGGLMAKVSMDILIEALFQAVLSEENLSLIHI